MVRYGLNTLPNNSENSIPVPDTSVSSVRPQYRYLTIREVRYDVNTGTRHCGKGILPYTGGIYPTEVVWYGLNTLPNNPVWFGMKSIPVPDTLVSSVRLQYRYPTLRQVRYDLNIGTRHFGKVRYAHRKIPCVTVYPTEHSLGRLFCQS